ncbi:hypothetical protein [Alkalihalobacillus pseudalcaliphilus]|uniref:hypothetical protein n=1 Tax=Alkalihalobacillus pseudalcaliphilus TaxID=79884 RepID=UPI00064E0D90|nr:hypothetical protein [Alkalihalobacillus pseudalcaliphilus]KMK75774.1 hypothetical protein AB990_10930 [Alkalihalobacillus pseudalcaliphilus]
MIDSATLKVWEERLFKDFDVFFFENKEEASELLPREGLVMTKEEFKQDGSFYSMDVNNNLTLWNLKKAANYVGVLPAGLFAQIPLQQQMRILQEQVRLGRGFVWTDIHIEELFRTSAREKKVEIKSLLQEHFLYEAEGLAVYFIDQINWSGLSGQKKVFFIQTMADLFIDPAPAWEQLPLSVQNKIRDQYDHLMDYINHFPLINGANCFSAALAMATEDKELAVWIIKQWVQPQALLFGLEQRNYERVEIHSGNILTHLLEDDILLWKKDGALIHACYYLGENYAFNKNGQMIFNPWQIVTVEGLLQSWEGNVEIYRKKLR